MLLLAAPQLSAQETETEPSQSDDVEIAMEFGIEKKLSKKFSLGIDMEYRTRDSGAEIDRVTLGPKLEYKIASHLKADVGGVYMLVYNDSKTRYRTDGSLKWIRDEHWGPRYRAFASLTGDIDVGRFNFSFRERYQYTYRESYTADRDYYTRAGQYNYTEDDVRESKTTHVLRSRISAEYDIHNCPLSPFAYVELYNNITEQWRKDKIRYAGGVTWKVNKKNSIELRYIYQDVNGEDADDDINSHYITVGYKYKF